MAYRIDFEGGSYSTAGGPLFDAGEGVGFTVERLASALSGTGQMAGDHAAGRSFATAYDGAASSVLTAMASLAHALAKMGSLVDMAAYNHALADAVSHPRPGAGPVMPSRAVVTYHPAKPPSATGGTGEEPSWWQHVIDAMPGLEWPDADTGRLHAAAAAWDQAASGLEIWRSSCTDAKALLTASRSPEVTTGSAAITRLDTAMGTLATQCRALGTQCRDYANAVEKSRQDAENTVKGALVALGVTAAAGGIAIFLTGGFATPAVAGGASVEVAAVAGTVATELGVAAAEAGTAAAAVTTAGTTAVEVAAVAAPFEAAVTEVAAVTAAGEATATAGAGTGLATNLASTAANGGMYAKDHAQGLGEFVSDPWGTTKATYSRGGLGAVLGGGMEFAGAFLPGGIGKGSKALNVVEEGVDYAPIGRDATALRRAFPVEGLSSKQERSRLAKAITERAKELARDRPDTSVDTSRVFTAETYREGLRQVHPDLTIAQVHHRIEQQLGRTGLFSDEEIHALASLRGIPEGAVGPQIHQGVIRRVYDAIYREAGARPGGLTRADVLGAADAIDEYLGHLFVPPHP